MLVAVAEAVTEMGIARVSVAEVVARAGVSRRTFYESFEDRNDCLVAALEFAVERATRRAVTAWHEHDGWQDAMRASLGALLGFLDEEPVLGTLLLVDWPAAWGLAVERRSALLGQLIAAVDAGRRLPDGCAPASELTAEGVVGAVLAVLRARLYAADGAGQADVAQRGSTSDMLGELMAIVVLPYRGPAAAAQEVGRPRPHAPASPVHGSSDALRRLKIRLTYRTVMVLRTVGSNPGASNREVAAQSGIADPGQVSKLLARLASAGLIENVRNEAAARECNAWSLTASGAAVERATSRDSRTAALAG